RFCGLCVKKMIQRTPDCPAVIADRFKTLRYDEETDEVVLLDRRKYPFQSVYERYQTAESVAVAVEEMVVQGGPPLAYAAGLGLALAAREVERRQVDDWQSYLQQTAARLLNTRPTADDLHHIIPCALEVGLEGGREAC